jgi:hypothetical protein
MGLSTKILQYEKDVVETIIGYCGLFGDGSNKIIAKRISAGLFNLESWRTFQRFQLVSS